MSFTEIRTLKLVSAFMYEQDCYEYGNCWSVFEDTRTIFQWGGVIVAVNDEDGVSISMKGIANVNEVVELLNGLPGVKLKRIRGGFELNGKAWDGALVIVEVGEG